jgi:transposase
MRRQLKNTENAFAGQVFFVGIDVHKQQWTCSVRSSRLSLARPVVIDASAEALSRYLHRQYPGGTYQAVYEAGYSGFWPARELKQEAIETMVVNPSDVPSRNKELTNKTDRVDSAKLARSLENGELKGIYIPERKAEEFRALNRYRNQLVKDETRLKNRLKAIMAQFNYRVPQAMAGHEQSKAYRVWLSGIRFDTAWQERLHQLEESRQRRARLLREMRRLAAEDPQISQVTGLLTAMLLATELVDMKRFRKEDDLVAYVGLVPMVYESDQRSYQRGLSQRCNQELRSRLIEAAWIAVRKDPGLTMKFSQLKQRMHPNKAIVRIAKMLIQRIRHVWKTQTPYEIGIIN